MTNTLIARLTAAMAVAAFAGTTMAAPYTPAADPGVYLGNDSAQDWADANWATSHSGQYDHTHAAVRVKGSGGTFNSVRINVPVILDQIDPLFNSAVVENDNGTPRGAVPTFIDVFAPGLPGRNTPDEEKRFQHYANAYSFIAAFGPLGNDLLINESLAQPNCPIPSSGAINVRDWSNGFGSILSDGTALFRANFNSVRRPTQNNIEFANINAAVSGSGTQVYFDNFQIDDFGAGGIFLTPPAGVRAANGDLLVGQTTFSADFDFGAPDSGPVPYYMNVWRYAGAPLNISLPTWRWMANTAPSLTNTANVTEVLANYRPTNARLMKLVNAGCNTETFYSAHGYGSVSAGGVFSGGGFNARAIYVDVLNAQAQTNGFTDGVVAILPNPAGGGTATYNSGTNAVTGLNPAYSFLTGQGSGQNVMAFFDINSKGQVAIVWEDNSAPKWEVRRYDPIYDVNNPCRIVGYNAPVVIIETGVSYNNNFSIKVPVDYFAVNLTAAGATTTNCAQAVSAELRNSNVVPISGVGIDEDGNVAFAAVTDVFTQNVQFFNPCNQAQSLGFADDLRATTTGLFLHHASSDTVHLLVQGGQTGDNIAPRVGAPANTPSVQLGFFPTSQQTDGFGAEGFSDSGLFLATCFRDGSDEGGIDSNADGFAQNGGTLSAVAAASQPEKAVRGVVLVSAGAFTPPPACPGDANGDGLTNGADLSVLLGQFGTSVTPSTGADFNGDGQVNGADLSVLLSNFGCGS